MKQGKVKGFIIGFLTVCITLLMMGALFLYFAEKFQDSPEYEAAVYCQSFCDSLQNCRLHDAEVTHKGYVCSYFVNGTKHTHESTGGP